MKKLRYSIVAVFTDSSVVIIEMEQDNVIKQYPYICGIFKNTRGFDMVLETTTIPGGATNVMFLSKNFNG